MEATKICYFIKGETIDIFTLIQLEFLMRSHHKRLFEEASTLRKYEITRTIMTLFLKHLNFFPVFFLDSDPNTPP